MPDTRQEEFLNLPFQEKRQIIEAITDRIVIGKEDVEIQLHHVATEKTEERHRSGRRPAHR